MESLVITLVVCGILLISFEIFVPGGILGIAGGLCLLGASGAAFYHWGPFVGILALISSALLCVTVIFLEFRLLTHTRLGNRFVLRNARKGQSAPPVAEDAVLGKIGEALTPFTPTGVIQIEGRTYEASCTDGAVERGQQLEVIGKDHYRLLVRRV